MKSRFARMLVVPAFVFATLAGCSPTGESKVKIADNVVILEQGPASQATVEPDRLVFPFVGNENLLNTRVGDLLVSGVGEGFYRRVTAYYWDGDQLVFLTEQASLTDIVIEGEMHKESVLGSDPDDALSASSYPLGTITQGLEVAETEILGIGLDDTALWFAPELVDLKLTEGHIRFSPTLKLDLVIKNATIVKFEAVVTGVLDFEFVIKLVAKGMFGYTTPIELWESLPMVLPPIMIGPVPVPTTATFGLDLVFEAAVGTESELEGGLGGNALVSLGARFDYGLWSPVLAQNLELWRIGPRTKTAAGKSGIKVSLQPRMDLKFAGVAGPRFFLEPSAAISSERDVAPICTLVGGLQAGISLSVLGLDPYLAEYALSTDLIEPVELGKYIGNALGICDAEVGNCVSDSDTDFCLNQLWHCGSVTAMDNCGTTRMVDCGICTDPAKPNCNSDTGVCECAPDCGVRQCGPVPNGCGETCGTCPDVQVCSSESGVCLNAPCGDSVCGAGEDCASCSADCGACPADCDNGRLDPGETCDPPASCPTSCEDNDPCTANEMSGSASSCNLACSFPKMDQDQDFDGFLSGQCPGGDDCDDADASTHPGADDVCDGRDNDCDSETDESPCR